jgi:hypothetical protein
VFPRLFAHRRIIEDQAGLEKDVAAGGWDDAIAAAFGREHELEHNIQDHEPAAGAQVPEAAAAAAVEDARAAGEPSGSGLPGSQGRELSASVQGLLQEGDRRVATYPELVTYLIQQGGPTAQVSALAFEGANRVVYRPQMAP